MSEAVEKVESASDARRRILNIAVATVLFETGFDSADKVALETLTEILQCCEYFVVLLLIKSCLLHVKESRHVSGVRFSQLQYSNIRRNAASHHLIQFVLSNRIEL